jgi:hypothetical protein
MLGVQGAARGSYKFFAQLNLAKALPISALARPHGEEARLTPRQYRGLCRV